MVKIAILNGYKMTLPYYGKFNGMYGFYTSEGFIYAFTDDNEGVITQQVEPIKYSNITSCLEKDVDFIYNSMENEEY